MSLGKIWYLGSCLCCTFENSMEEERRQRKSTCTGPLWSIKIQFWSDPVVPVPVDPTSNVCRLNLTERRGIWGRLANNSMIIIRRLIWSIICKSAYTKIPGQEIRTRKVFTTEEGWGSRLSSCIWFSRCMSWSCSGQCVWICKDCAKCPSWSTSWHPAILHQYTEYSLAAVSWSVSAG